MKKTQLFLGKSWIQKKSPPYDPKQKKIVASNSLQQQIPLQRVSHMSFSLPLTQELYFTEALLLKPTTFFATKSIIILQPFLEYQHLEISVCTCLFIIQIFIPN